MGKDDARRKPKAASSSRAGELLAVGPTAPAGAGFGFGGYIGAQSLADVRASTAAEGAQESLGGGNLDSELSLHLRRLSKRDAVTKLKALQALKLLVKEKTVPELEAFLPAWGYIFQRLVMDNARVVREEAAAVMGSTAKGAGRGLAPFLKQMIGPWVLAVHDLQPEVVKAARTGMAAALPGAKSQEALKLYQAQVLEYMAENLKATPEVLGDPQRESPEEMRERQERLVASSLLALGSLTELADPAQGGSEQLLQKLRELFSQPGFFKKFTASKSPMVRRSAYNFLSTLSSRQPGVLQHHVSDAAPSVFGAFGDKDPSTHPELWDMVLAFSKAFPPAWQAVDVRKVVLPKLLAFLRSGCYGSATGSFPALLPLLALLPEELVAADVPSMQQILDAILIAWGQLHAASGLGSGLASAAAADCFVESWAFVVSRVQSVASTEVDSAAQAGLVSLGATPLASRLLPSALSRATDISDAALRLLAASLSATQSKPGAQPGSGPNKIFVEALSSATLLQIKEALKSPSESPAEHIYMRVESLLAVLGASVDDDAAHSWLADILAIPILDLLAKHSGGERTLAAARLLAFLIRRYGRGTEIGAAAGGLKEARENFLQLPLGSPAASYHADILLACMSASPDPARALADTLSSTLNEEPSAGGVEQAAVLVGQLVASQSSCEGESQRGQEGFEENGNPGKTLTAWASKELDELALNLSAEHLKTGTEEAGELVGTLIKGDGNTSLLSAETVATLAAKLRALAESCSDESPQQQFPALLSCLRCCLFSEPLWAAGGGAGAEQSAGLWLLAFCFELAVRADRQIPATLEFWDGDYQPVKQLRRLLDLDRRQALDLQLLKVLQKEMRRLLQSKVSAEVADSLADAAIQLIRILEPEKDGPEAIGDILSQILLTLQPRWPKFVAPPPHPGCLDQSEARAAAGMPAFAASLCRGLGLEQVFERSSRAWLAAELLCWAAAGDESALQLHQDLKALLASSTSGEQQPSEAGEGLLAGVAQSLWGQQPEGKALRIVRAQVLSSLIVAQLAEELSDSGSRTSTFQALFRKWIGSGGQTQIVGETEKAFTLLISRLRDSGEEAVLQASGLTQLASERMRKAAAQQPLWQAVHYSPGQVATSLQCLRDVTACFPISVSAGALPRWATASERTALAKLVERELTGERAAEAAEAAVRRGLEGSEQAPQDGPSGRSLAEAEAVLGALLASAASYCWQQLQPGAQEQLLKRVCRGVQEATVCLEEAVEKLGGAALEAARRLSPEGPAVAPKAAVALLRELQKGLSDHAAQLFQDAMEGVEEILADDETVAVLSRCPRVWLESSAVTLPCILGSDPSQALPEAAASLLADSLRCLLVLGIISSTAEAAGEGAKLLCSHWMSDLEPLVAAVAASCWPALKWPGSLAEACQAVDIWADETGVDAVGASLALLASSHPAVQKLGLQSLLQPSVLSRLAEDVQEEDEEADAERRAAAESAPDHVALLTSAGLRPELASALGVALPEFEGEEEERWLLSWAALLAFLLHLPPESVLRATICQAIHESHSMAPALCSRLVSLLPLESAKAEVRPSAKVLPGQAAADAARARADGKVPEAWEFCKALEQAEELKDSALAPDVYRALLRVLPASVRSWFQSIRDKKLTAVVEAYTAARESSQIITDELAGVSGRAAHGEMTDAGSIEFSVRAKFATREAVALVALEDSAVLELSIQLPVAWPLHDARIDCRKKMGVAESRLRKWMLSITALLRSQNGALSDAISLWQRNCARQFAGVEECLICYNVILAGTGQLPKLACRTCSKRYHGVCLYKWFRSSSKSVCPHCQSPW